MTTIQGQKVKNQSQVTYH